MRYDDEEREMLTSTMIVSPVGELTLVAGDQGLRALLWPRELERESRAAVGARLSEITTIDANALNPTVHPVLAQTVRELHEYFAGDRQTFDVALDPVGTPFQRRAWMALRQIPYGSTVSYGDQARRLGDVKMARAVGAANGRNPISIIVPCHRVIGSTGKLTGFGGGLGNKDWLLRHESNALFQM